MSSDTQSALESLQINNYISLVIVTAVIYDYLLTFSREIHYIWCRPWTWVSTMFVLVRYVGLPWTILIALNDTPFIPGPVETYAFKLQLKAILITFYRCDAVIWATEWTYAIFINSADLVMILRVYALWSRSKRILYLLLFIYVPVLIATVVGSAVYNPGTNLSVAVVQLMNFSFCNTTSTNTAFMLYAYEEIPRSVLSVTLLILAATQTLKQSINMYRATKLWQPNRYMEQLVRDGILYFLANMFASMYGLFENGATGSNAWVLIMAMLAGVTLCPMMARFIISVRELYDRDLRRGLQGDDTGFGALSQPAASQIAPVSAIAFADVAPGQEQDAENPNESEAIRLELLEDETRQV